MVSNNGNTATTEKRPDGQLRNVDAERYFAYFMHALGFDPGDDPHLEGTPKRVAAMYAELLGGHEFSFTTFPAEGSQMVTVANIPFVSFCAHHFLPFTGVAHVGYIPSERIAGLSKLARAVRTCAQRPQVQERLTVQIADFLHDHLAPEGLGVVLSARHECMELRGVRAIGSTTVTADLRGLIFDDADARAEFYSAIDLASKG